LARKDYRKVKSAFKSANFQAQKKAREDFAHEHEEKNPMPSLLKTQV
jgi:hypothetical protein